MQRFEIKGDAAQDKKTGLMWPRNANVMEFPLTWQEALDGVFDLNAASFCGYKDWKLPNRRELFSLVSHEEINPSLPAGHPFENVFTGYYWTATTCARLPDQAWYVHMGGARVHRGMKQGSYMVWPVRVDQPASAGLLRTGQGRCYDAAGKVLGCSGTGQDGAFRAGTPLPENRYESAGKVAVDNAMGLMWPKNAALFPQPMDWAATFSALDRMNQGEMFGFGDWRLPGIRELEGIIHMENHSPALSGGHPFYDVRPFYWSETTSRYNPDYAWVLYMQDGAVGVGYKPLPEFYFWPVRDA